MPRQIKPRERTDHEDVAMREVDEAQDAINHRIAQRDERVNRAQRQTVDYLLNELVQKARLRSNSFQVLKFPVLHGDDHRALARVSLLINRGRSSRSREIFRGGERIADLWSIG